MGDWVQERVPVIAGVGQVPNLPRLKHFGAAASSSGGVEMYHLVGVTPEAAEHDGAGLRRQPRRPSCAATARRERARHAGAHQRQRQRPPGRLRDARLPALHASSRSGKRRGCSRAARCTRTASCGSSRRARSRQSPTRTATRRSSKTAGGKLMTDSCSAMSRAVPQGHQGGGARLGQAGPLPARHPGHAGLVRHHRRMHRRGLHRALERRHGMTVAETAIVLRGRCVVPGVAEGEALVTTQPHLGLGRHRPAQRHRRSRPATSCAAELRRQGAGVSRRQGLVGLVGAVPRGPPHGHRAGRDGCSTR